MSPSTGTAPLTAATVPVPVRDGPVTLAALVEGSTTGRTARVTGTDLVTDPLPVTVERTAGPVTVVQLRRGPARLRHHER